jgi:hypothetical protein
MEELGRAGSSPKRPAGTALTSEIPCFRGRAVPATRLRVAVQVYPKSTLDSGHEDV